MKPSDSFAFSARQTDMFQTCSKSMLAPAKINLCLYVTGKRPDGYHELAMLMQRLALFDQVTVELAPGEGVSGSCPGLVLPAGAENLACRAARLMLEHVGVKARVSVRVEKRIPAAAGLGGGSSDAAAVLLLLEELLDLQLPCHELMQLGLQLGADVPFFLFRKTAWAMGVGEILQAWPGLPPLWVVLVNPGFAVSTAWVFQNLRLTGQRAKAKIPRFPVRVEEVVRLLHNDLESVTRGRHPIIGEIKECLLAEGAAGVLMSGSGPTVFGLFRSPEDAERAASHLSAARGWWTAAVGSY